MLTSKDNYNINFTGLTHDHFQSNSHACKTAATNNNGRADADQLCSVIGILRRHPMYDCLLLVKKYRNCLGGYSLEFPTDRLRPEELQVASDQDDDEENKAKPGCNQRRLVSRYLDGDDPMHQHTGTVATPTSPLPPVVSELIRNTSCEANIGEPVYLVDPFMAQVDDKGDHCELVHVPINGLLDRLEGYTRSQVAVDSRVYSFAMGLKTAERIMTTKSMKELQETPI